VGVKRLLRAAAFALAASLLLLSVEAAPARAAMLLQASPWSLGGDAKEVTGEPPMRSAFEISSKCIDSNGGAAIVGCIETGILTTSSVIFDPPHKLKFADLFQLGTDFTPTFTDCGAGSPRFQINIDLDRDGFPDGNVFVYLGPLFDFTLCSGGWQSTGNLIGTIEPRYDLTHFGGPFYGTYFEALALVGEFDVCGVQLMVDSAWWPFLRVSFPPYLGLQIFQVNHVKVNQFTLSSEPSSSLDDEVRAFSPVP
jgi:hypothetical protein